MLGPSHHSLLLSRSLHSRLGYHASLLPPWKLRDGRGVLCVAESSEHLGDLRSESGQSEAPK